ncbi:murein transglycosylase A [Legionella saoudiensis]|uniref:murein transglycosylase A n=1 Tax=Legionella saoudiensis TaxID=1750561 RepID=UPI00072FE6CD|nr:MltA domain-containing protein [Legionella saoudiensis]
MNKKLICTTIIIGLVSCTWGLLHYKKPHEPKQESIAKVSPVSKLSKSKKTPKPSAKTVKLIADAASGMVSKQVAAQLAKAKELAKKSEVEAPKKPPEKPIKVKRKISSNLALSSVSFEELPGWDTADVKKSLLAFQLSCKTFLKKEPSHPIGSQHIKLKAGDWHPACKAAVAIETVSEDIARTFFEKWFHPIKFEQKKPVKGLFTGYYMPQIKGGLKKTSKYSTPIYGLPKRGGRNKTRAQIDNGALKKKAPVIAWIHSPIERLFLEIEGSGVILLPDGKSIYLGYAGENGAPYTSVAKILINKGIMTRDNASKEAIIRYLEAHPQKAKEIMHQNKSFVFFESLKKPMALGAQGMALTPGYSLAVDKKWIPLGAPLWLSTTRPEKDQDEEKRLQRLMIAQDTGGAIRGFMRGDIYWGSGKMAAFWGEHMKNKGRYWLLLPKHILKQFAKR